MTDYRNNPLKVGDNIKIISCSGPDFWYKLYVGNIFKISSIINKTWRLNVFYAGTSLMYSIDKADCIKVDCLKNKIRKLKRLIKK